ncbi:MAG TPA: tetratricopeptide repeat protein [Ignavibacteriaceae bacterium]|nr:tetratricopeptide repeat protein [Ignavibacteriaceae bacterium]
MACNHATMQPCNHRKHGGHATIHSFIHSIVLFMFIALLPSSLFSQSLRGSVNDGVDFYKQKKYTDAEVRFKKGLDADPNSFEANFNLGDAYYKQNNYGQALNAYNTALSEAKTNTQKAGVYHNMGNSLLKSQKLEESINAYKNALRLNPNDQETKYNLSYALAQLKNQQNRQNQNNQNQNQNQNQKDQQNKNQDRQKNQNQNQEKNKPDQNQQATQDNVKQREKDKISKEEAERILQALKNNEKDLQKKLRKKVAVPVETDKDW